MQNTVDVVNVCSPEHARGWHHMVYRKLRLSSVRGCDRVVYG